MKHDTFQFYIPVSKNIALTEVLEFDRASLKEYLNEKEIYLQTFAIPYPYGDAEVEWFLNHLKEKMTTEAQPTTMAIRRTEDHKLIGVFGFHEFEPGVHKVEIGYWLAKPYWNQGIATEVVDQACQFAFEHLRVVRIYAKAFTRNHGSIRVLKKLGFSQEGLLSKDVIKEGEMLDVALFGLLKV